MRRLLAMITIATTVLVGAASTAVADPGDYYADGFESATQGTGSAHADTEADRFGNLSATSSATGGTAFLVPILELLPYSNPSSAAARAFVSDGGEVTEGVYEITVTYTNAQTDESETGTGVAQGRALAKAGFFDGGGGHSITVGADAVDLPSEPGTVVLSYEVNIPADGQIGISAEIQALTNANGEGNAASATSSGQVTDISFTKVG